MESWGVYLQIEGITVKQDDLSRILPLLFSHINMNGKYTFTIPKEIANGELRLKVMSADRDHNSEFKFAIQPHFLQKAPYVVVDRHSLIFLSEILGKLLLMDISLFCFMYF